MEDEIETPEISDDELLRELQALEKQEANASETFSEEENEYGQNNIIQFKLPEEKTVEKDEFEIASEKEPDEEELEELLKLLKEMQGN